MLRLTRTDKINAINNINEIEEKLLNDSQGACFIEVLIDSVKTMYKIPGEINLSFREALIVMISHDN